MTRIDFIDLLDRLASPEVFIPITLAMIILIAWRASRKS
jgi:hypothetical protein